MTERLDPLPPESDETHISYEGESPALTRNNPPPRFPAYLDVLDGALAGRRLLLPKTRTVLGRQECDLSFPQDPLVSRKHAAIELYNRDYILIRDLASTNGTFVNGRLVNQARMSLGDELRIGNVVMRLSADEEDHV
ncbi:MAG: FHA domain-containing protein [Acidobacteriota bacterium]|jgi:hypothetical protein